MFIDITERLRLDPKRDDELECFLSDYFNKGSQSEKNYFVYGDDVSITYSNKRKSIQKIQWLKENESGEIELLEKEMKTSLYEDVGQDVGECYIFSKQRIEGFYRNENNFQIIPVPDQAPSVIPKNEPHLKFLIGDHPGILQFSYPTSSNSKIKRFREGKRKDELLLVLYVFLRGGVTGSKSVSRREWVLKKEKDEFTSEICTLGYSTDVSWDHKDEIGFWINDTWSQLPRTPSRNYFSDYRIPLNERLSLPDNFESLFKKYESLSEEDLDKFLRSTYWFRCPREINYNSMSLSYTVLVFAIEALLPKVVDPEFCPECGASRKPSIYKRFLVFIVKFLLPKVVDPESCLECGTSLKPSINKQFKAFLDVHCSGLEPKLVAEFMGLRSKYVHGSSLMISDKESTGFRFSSPINQERDHFDTLSSVCLVSILNWLTSPERTNMQSS